MKLNLDDHYAHIREVPNHGLCGLGPLAYTVGLFCGLDAVGYKYRYCYANWLDALDALEAWDGTGDPSGPWIVRKGEGGDYRNPEFDS